METKNLELGHFLYSRIPPDENGPFRLDFFSTGIFWFFFLSHFLYSRIPPVENGPFRLGFFSTGFFWFFFSSSVELIL